MKEFTNIQVDFDQIPKSSALHYFPLEWKYIYILLFNGFLVFVMLVAALIYLWTLIEKDWFQDNFIWILLAVLAFFCLVFATTYKAFFYKGYAFREKDISYKSGWLWRKITTLSFNRVQHCEVSQGVFDRYFGLAKIKVFTAGGSSSDLVVPGLTLDQASDLKDYILEKIKEDE